MEKMAKKMLIDATHLEETRVVVADGNKIEEFDFESKNRKQIAGNIYLAKVSRIEPSLQAAFIEYGGNRHGFLAYSEIHPDYYQIPVADREALIAEELEFSRKSEEQFEVQTQHIIDKVKSEDFPPDSVESKKLTDTETVYDPSKELVDTEIPTVEANSSAQTIESVGQEDDVSELIPRRRTRSKRYKIQEVIKVRQILLIQVVKEERGNKGAALTTYLSLAGRYCVLMPNTAKGGGISRKITNVNDRKKLKDISSEIDVPKGAGLIVRTAGAKRTKSEIKRDYEYLLRQWEQIRDLTLKSIAPAPIYQEGDLIKRSIRDLYNRDIDELLIEGEAGFKAAQEFMKMIMPTHTKNVKLYADSMPLFARYQVESPLSGMFSPTVQLKSGGYIVIGITEALVAVDVNSGRATKEGSIEQTALNTNLEAAEEIARQMRLRDLAGLIVIDFIDMDERKNNIAVEKLMKEKLSKDRARIQVGRISGFGLLEMSRQRLRPGMLEVTTQACAACHGTGLIRSNDSLSLTILRQLEEEGTRGTSKEVLLKAPVGIVNYLMNEKREHISIMESRYGLAIRLEADTNLISPDFSIEKFKTATRNILTDQKNVVSMGSIDLSDLDDEIKPDLVGASNDRNSLEQPKKRRRRRRKPGKQRETSGQTIIDESATATVENSQNKNIIEQVDKSELKLTESDSRLREKNPSSSSSGDDDKTKSKKKVTRKKPEKSISQTRKKVKELPLNNVKEVENTEKPKKKRVSKIVKTTKDVSDVLEDKKIDKKTSKSTEKNSEIDISKENSVDVSDKAKPKTVKKRTSKANEKKSLVTKSRITKEPKRTGWWSSGT